MGINIQQGTVNTTNLVVPGLYVGVVPPQPTQLNGVPSNIAGFVGTAAYGPVNTPIPWQDYPSFAASFGVLQNRLNDLGTSVSIAVQQGASSGYAVRVTDGTDTAATVQFGVSGGNYALLLTAKYTGSAGNLFTATFQTSQYPGAVKLVLATGLGQPETFDNLSTASNSVFWNAVANAINSGNSAQRPRSQYFIATVGTNASTSAVPVLTIPHTLSGGTDGVGFATTITTVATTQGAPGVVVSVASATGISTGQLVYAANVPYGTRVQSISGTNVTLTQSTTIALTSGTSLQFGATLGNAMIGADGVAGTRTGMYALRGTGCSVAGLCDLYETFTFPGGGASPTVVGDIWTYQATFGLSERIYMISTAAAGDSPTNWIGFNAPGISGASSYGLKCMFGDWLTWQDSVNNAQRMVSPIAFVVGRIANQSPALSTLNQPIYGIIGSQFSNSGLIYGNLDILTLINAGFDVITPPGQGPGGQNFWTCATGNNSNYNPAAQGDNYTTMTNYIVSTIAAVGGLAQFLGQLITPALLNEEKAVLDAYYQNLQDAGLIGNSQGTQCFQNTFTQTPTQAANGIVIISSLVTYLAVQRELVVNLQGGQTVVIQNQSGGPGQ